MCVVAHLSLCPSAAHEDLKGCLILTLPPSPPATFLYNFRDLLETLNHDALLALLQNEWCRDPSDALKLNQHSLVTT